MSRGWCSRLSNVLANTASAISANVFCHIPFITYNLLYIRLSRTSNKYKITLKMATAMLVETSDNLQHSTRIIPTKSKSHIKDEIWGCHDSKYINVFLPVSNALRISRKITDVSEKYISPIFGIYIQKFRRPTVTCWSCFRMKRWQKLDLRWA
jgi:hypothetical protein